MKSSNNNASYGAMSLGYSIKHSQSIFATFLVLTGAAMMHINRIAFGPHQARKVLEHMQNAQNSTKMIIITDLLIINHLIFVCYFTVITLVFRHLNSLPYFI